LAKGGSIRTNKRRKKKEGGKKAKVRKVLIFWGTSVLRGLMYVNETPPKRWLKWKGEEEVERKVNGEWTAGKRGGVMPLLLPGGSAKQ